jgi:hypothetical protein
MPSSVPGALDPPTAWLGSDGLCELGSERSVTATAARRREPPGGLVTPGRPDRPAPGRSYG